MFSFLAHVVLFFPCTPEIVGELRLRCTFSKEQTTALVEESLLAVSHTKQGSTY